jgi:hypothetical protein
MTSRRRISATGVSVVFGTLARGIMSAKHAEILTGEG